MPWRVKFLWQLVFLAIDIITLTSTGILVLITAVDATVTYVHAVRFGPDVEASLLPRMFLDNFGPEGIWLWLAGLISVYIAIELTTLLGAKVIGQLADNKTGKIVNFLRVIFLRPMWFCITFILILMHHSLLTNTISTIRLLVDSP